MSEGGGLPGSPALRAAFRIGLALYTLAFAGGVTWAIRNEGRPPLLGDSALFLADRAYARGDVQRAAREYRMVARIDASNYDTPRRLAEMLRKAGDASGDVDRYLRATELWPADAATHRNLGWAYLQQRKVASARASFERAAALDPKDAATQHGLGEALLEEQRFAEAVVALSKSVESRPDDAAIQNSLGMALGLAGRDEDAVAHFEIAARLNPDYQGNLERARLVAARR
jgi:tetratricopeptide (TPR) repeat protein